ncbi:hypothetical protein FB45DRAFT_942423 [Roridomyces roridus]|uniref:Uncharacterized protein n=1 Tax=Roridomyces roridus TaxID=1738132 RepID=A0AAD7F9F3_9AGAR|nr:hypothetical protein FB45DRAFT_942423 [Roridomyces roridus]
MELHWSQWVWKRPRRRRKRRCPLPSSWIVALHRQATPAEFSHSQVVLSSRAGRSQAVTMSIGRQSRFQFQAIPLGDLYPSHEIARRRYGGRGVKRIFSTELRGSRVTAMTYEGKDAEQQWREEVSRYSRIRHPNIAQLFGVAHCGLKAAVFHGEMIPYKEVLRTFGGSHFLSVYFWVCMTTEFKGVDN